MKTTSLPIVTALCLLAMSQLASGAESQILDEITVRGQKEAPKEESLSIREVRESPARDMGEALKQVEGISYVHKGAIANDIVLRGFQKDNINVLVDGIRLHGACPNRMDPPAFHYDFAEIEQVKIVKGPYDLTNPGGMGGSVDAITKVPEKGAGAELTMGYGAWNSFNASATASYGADTFDGLLGYAYKYSDVPRSGDGKRLTEIYPTTGSAAANRYKTSFIDSKAYEINTGWGKVGFNPTTNSRTDVSYTYQDADHVLYPYLKMDADYDKTHRVNWNYRIQKISPLVQELKLQAYWDRVSHLMDDRFRVSSQTSPRFYSMQTDAKTQVYGVKLNGTLAAGGGMLRTGLDYYNRNWEAINRRAGYFAYRDLATIPDASVDNLGMFADYERPLSSTLTLRGGMRGDLTWAEAGKGNNLVTAGTNLDFGEISANLQLTYSPVKGLDIFTGVARGTRTPDQQELFFDLPGTAMSPVGTRGNPGLKPTVNHQADFGIKYSAENFYVNASLFYSDLQNYINIYQASPTLKSYQNIHASMWGAELGSQIALPLDLFLKGSLSYVEAQNVDTDKALSEIPPLRGTISLRYDNGTFFVEAAENLTREQDRVDASLKEERTAGWATTDLKGGVSYQGLTLIIGINNLFDKYYYSHLSYARDPFASGIKVPENGRNVYISASYKF